MNNIVIAVFQILLAVGFLGFWLYFFWEQRKMGHGKDDNPYHTDKYYAFEKSFPVPDIGWAVPTLIISAIGLFLENDVGIFFSALSGSALVFLGLLDTSFNARNGGYASDNPDRWMNILINSVCLVLGPVFILFSWINF